MPIYVYWGEEEFNIELAVKRLRAKVLDPDWATFNHKVLDSPSIQTLIETITTIPMGFGEVLIEVRNQNIFSRKTKGKEKEKALSVNDEKDLKLLLDLLPEISERVNLLFVIIFPRNSKRKVDKTLKTTKAVEKYGVIQQFEAFSPFKPNDVISWINDAARELKVKINHDASLHLFECCGTDLRKINTELNKLSTYVGEGNIIKLSDVKLLCSGIDNIFNLAEHWVQGKRYDSQMELAKLLDKDHPIKIIASLQSIITEWLHIKLELKYGNNSTTLAKEIGMHPFRLKKTISNLQNVPIDRLSRLKEQLTQYENKMKTGQIKAELAMEILMTM